MNTNVATAPEKPKSGLLDGASLTNLAATGEVEIAGRRYVTADRLAATPPASARLRSKSASSSSSIWRSCPPG